MTDERFKWHGTADLTTDMVASLKLVTGRTRYGPGRMWISGGGLNELLGTDEYDATKVYEVTEDGITELHTP